ncbi:polysaccharide deacetylase family protein [Pseudonocardia sp.]|uniref:polysaccharide deacetylase family protein n=1 Tax=Pseudonocardia sp. TaxID=60912 RepID=UPI003D0C0FF5
MSRTEQAARLLRLTRLDALARRTWSGLLIFNYHRFGSAGPHDDPDLFSATLEDFDTHVAELADRFEIVAAGSAEWNDDAPARRVAITVDDGYRDQVGAAEVLARRGVTGTFFVCTGFVDTPHHAWWDEIAWLTGGGACDLPPSEWFPTGLDSAGMSTTAFRRRVNLAYKARAGEYGEKFLDDLADAVGRARLAPGTSDHWMSWDDVRRVRELGMEMGAHTVTHPVLATLPKQRQHDEVATSIERLSAELAEPVDLFSYPVGARASFDDSTRGVLREIGVRRAFSFYGGVNGRRHDDMFDVQRAGVYAAHSTPVVRVMADLPRVLCKN